MIWKRPKWICRNPFRSGVALQVMFLEILLLIIKFPIFFTVMFALLFACSTNQSFSQETRKVSHKKTQSKMPDTIDSRSAGERQYFDSARFHIIRGKYVSGARFIEVCQNRITRIDNWKEYYENGNLKKIGEMITSTKSGNSCQNWWMPGPKTIGKCKPTTRSCVFAAKLKRW